MPIEGPSELTQRQKKYLVNFYPSEAWVELALLSRSTEY